MIFLDNIIHKKILLSILFFEIYVVCYSQQTQIVYGEYIYYTTESTSIEEAKKIALERAKIQSLADTFGTDISQSSTASISTINGKSDTNFFSLSSSDIKGEWLETIGDPDFKIEYESPLLIVHCKVKGRVREILRPELTIEAKTLKNGLSFNFESNDYMDGDDLYVYFRTSSSGYVTIYLIQNNIVYRLLPYRRSQFLEYYVNAEKSYIFFSKDTNIDKRDVVDEYEVYGDNELNSASIVIVFSTNPIGSPEVLSKAYDEPFSLDVGSFNEWIVKKRIKDKFSRVITLPITIKKS